MAMQKVRSGDVYQIQATEGVCFIQCVKESTTKMRSDIVRVLPSVFALTTELDVEAIASQKELFFSELPLKYAARKKLLSFVGNYEIPAGSEAPSFYRTEHIIGSEFLGWHIVDSETWHRKLVTTLSPDDIKLSPWGMISIPDIVERIENNWTPSEWV